MKKTIITITIKKTITKITTITIKITTTTTTTGLKSLSSADIPEVKLLLSSLVHNKNSNNLFINSNCNNNNNNNKTVSSVKTVIKLFVAPDT